MKESLVRPLIACGVPVGAIGLLISLVWLVRIILSRR
jgi:hypothetical protein